MAHAALSLPRVVEEKYGAKATAANLTRRRRGWCPSSGHTPLRFDARDVQDKCIRPPTVLNKALYEMRGPPVVSVRPKVRFFRSKPRVRTVVPVIVLCSGPPGVLDEGEQRRRERERERERERREPLWAPPIWLLLHSVMMTTCAAAAIVDNCVHHLFASAAKKCISRLQ